MCFVPFVRNIWMKNLLLSDVMRPFDPSCLGNSAPLCNESWFCSPCQDSVVIEPAVNQVNTAATHTDEVCSICQKRVEDTDFGLECDICDT